MTSKEKASELIHRFYSLDMIKHEMDGGGGFTDAKQLALICVEEVIDQWEYIDTYLADLGGELNPNLKYWYEVKLEIENYGKR